LISRALKHSSRVFAKEQRYGRVRKAETHRKRRRSMIRRFAILFAVALVSVSGAAACGDVQEELQKRAQEEVEKGRQQVEQKVQEGQQRVEEEVKKGQ
jgi:hypothetical protein